MTHGKLDLAIVLQENPADQECGTVFVRAVI